MNIEDLKRVLISFADNETDVIINKGEILAEVRGETIVAKLVYKNGGNLFIEEHGVAETPIIWIANRIANLHLLAERILDYTPKINNFIVPSGNLLNDIEIDPNETEEQIENIADSLIKKLDSPTPGTSNVLYLTSDAGEGKTTLIDQLSRKQAEDFKKKKTSWLIVPIPLGGRPFLRFDDIVVASLVNRLRFRLFYYDSFIELTKLGLIVPAFDGFEEMFMESSTGEALSATGNLMNKLHSSGSIVIAARKAYFDYKSFSSQARLFDSIGANSVSFSKISINRWDKNRFLLYATGKGIEDPEKIYEFLERKLGNPWHPLLTRPVLINQLLEVVKDINDIEVISSSLESTAQYFPKFVDAIIKREAETKWIDRSGEPYKPLLTVEQHYDLLSLISEEMWLNNTDNLPESVFDLISEIYCDSNGLSVNINRQVKERLKQHALIIKVPGTNNFKFDHDEFKEFFLGIAFVNKFNENKALEIKNLMRKGVVYSQTADTIATYLKNAEKKVENYLKLLNEIQIGEGPTSFVRENNGILVIRIANNEIINPTMVDNCLFPSNSLYSISIVSLNFKNSYFQATSFDSSKFSNCVFENCTFDRIEFSNNCKIENVEFKDCEIISVYDVRNDIDFYDPYNIYNKLQEIGVKIIFSGVEVENKEQTIESDEDLEIVEKAFRRFLRSTQVNDTIFKIRLGQKADYFFKELMPILIENEIIEEIDYFGKAGKRRFKLAVPFEQISQALIKSEGHFEKFIELAKKQ